jgi:uncharacterized membrane protein
MVGSGDLEELRREVDYQVEEYRHVRTEASRFLRISIAFLGIIGALLSAIGRIEEFIPNPPAITPEKARIAGVKLAESFTVLQPINEILAKQIIHLTILVTAIALLVAIISIVIRVPQATYRALKVREINPSPGESTHLVSSYQELKQKNNKELEAAKEGLNTLYRSLRVATWAITYSFTVYAGLFWLQKPTLAVYSGFLILLYFIGTTFDVSSIGGPERPLWTEFDSLTGLATPFVMLGILGGGISNLVPPLAWIIVGLISIFAYTRAETPKHQFGWAEMKSAFFGMLSMVIGVGIPLAKPNASNLMIVIALLLVFYAGTVAIVLVFMNTLGPVGELVVKIIKDRWNSTEVNNETADN